MGERRFNDAEVGEILRAAAGSASSSAEGMTLGELKKVAAELGIDPEDIAQAARELSPTAGQSLLLERSIVGELGPEAWDEMVTELRRFSGKPGTTTVTEKAWEWVGESDYGSVMLSVTRRKGRTRLRLLGDAGAGRGMVISTGFAFGILLTLIPLVVAFKRQPSLDPFLTAALCGMVASFCAWVTMGIVRSNRAKLVTQMGVLMGSLADLAESESVGETPILTDFVKEVTVQA